ncbi:hypothetical protein [Pyxidicoccus caerfyrddinensis]|uniref:hypothetical protein n=1 Tax=Pyxidicoccus caerfyrddinensis TaxID=2709663 RepID=UPI0013DD166A|nr:hypothetical protein [Pyxidicoccus caerfyrddinensis]
MPGTVTVGGSDYTTSDLLDSPSYCYRRAGVALDAAPHFTVTDTDSGRAQFKKFHITKASGKRWLRAYYDEKTFQYVTIAAPGERHSNVLIKSDAQAELDGLATAFWNAINT